DDLAGRRVAVIADNLARHLLAPRDDISLRVFPLFTDALFALLAGRVDALAYPEPVAWKLAREARVADQLKVVGRPLFEIKRAMAVRKDDVELLALLDLAVAEFVASPDYRRIYVAWFGEPSPFWTLTRAAWAMGVLFALSLIAMAGWRYRFVTKLNGRLERRVQERTAELRAAVAALRESQERFRDLAESASDWFWEIGHDLRITYLSDRIREVAGIEPSSVIGVHVRDLPTVNHEDSDWNAYMEALEERRPFRDLICQRRVDDGSIRSFQLSGRPVFDDQGEFLGFRCAATDVTARVRAEEALRRAGDELEQRVAQRTAELQEANEQLKKEIAERKLAEQALRESEERYKGLVETTNVIPWEADLSTWRFTYVGPQAVSLLGYPLDDWYGAGFWPNSIHPDDRDEAVAFCQASSARGEDHDFEYRVLTADGDVLWMRDVVTVVSDEHGPKALRGIMIDITERKRVEGEIHRLNADLERRVEERTAELRAAQVDLLRQERLATLGQLTATVSHELRNPLSVIRTSTFVARDGLDGTTPRVQRALERIDRSVTRCDRIIDELLDFTRISGLEPEPTPIDDWLDGTLKEQALPAQITLRRDFGLAGTTVPFDRDRFRRAIINVFDNACQAMTGEAGREAADADSAVLSVTTKRKNGRVEVIFEDRGPGIPADVLPRIFEPLFSTKGFGVGLGLPVVKQIMEQHGGGIEIDGSGKSGTRVCLWLPAEPPTQPRT
ncbi:MAG: PAS domain S-box protein, partial [Proteobacteria bacterium]|nr:PAS domain S-box protein [Pseudomonadota bacterium]